MSSLPKAVSDSASTEVIDVSVVVPVFNEEECLPLFIERIEAVLTKLDPPHRWEVIFVDDGSQDRSFAVILEACQKTPSFKAVRFTRNFGHQSALVAGLRAASGERIVTIDSDLQDPPELISEMLKVSRSGADVVHATRISRAGETVFKKALAHIFYRVFDRSVSFQSAPDSGDFRLITRAVQSQLVRMSEVDQYLRGQIAWLGFPSVDLPYHRAARHSGETKYPLRKQLRLAFDAIVGLSGLPLRFAVGLSLVLGGVVSLVGAPVVVLDSKFGGVPSTLLYLVLLSGIAGLLIVTAVLSVYLGRLTFQARKQPSFIIRETLNLESCSGVA